MAGKWQETTLGEVIELKRGYDLPKRERFPGPVPLVSSSGVTDYHTASKVAGPGVVTGRYGTLGEVFFVCEDFWPLNTTLYVRDFKSNNPRFISYFLKGIDFLPFSDKAAVPGLNRNHLHQAPVWFPDDVNEQRAIAHILGTLDDKIELNRRMNETLEAMARALFKDWFVDFGPTRAKIEGRDPYLAPEIWDLFPDKLDEDGKPEGWETQSVIDQAEWVNGAAYGNMHFSNAHDALPVVKIAELKAGVTKNTKRTNTELGDKYRIRDRELLFSWSGNPDTSIDTFIWTGGEAWLNQHIFAVRDNGARTPAFLYTMLKWLKPEFAEIARNKQTTGLGHVTKQDLKRMQIYVGPRELLEESEHLIGPLHARMQTNLVENMTLAQARDLLLPNLVSGEIRVGDTDKIVLEST